MHILATMRSIIRSRMQERLAHLHERMPRALKATLGIDPLPSIELLRNSISAIFQGSDAPRVIPNPDFAPKPRGAETKTRQARAKGHAEHGSMRAEHGTMLVRLGRKAFEGAKSFVLSEFISKFAGFYAGRSRKHQTI